MNIRWFPATLLLAALLGPQAAFAQAEPSSWLLKYISYYVNEGSNPPNIQEPTVLRFYGWLPYDCGAARDVAVIDQDQIHFKLRKISEICGDTTRTWSAEFNLGLLPLGDHQLTVTRTFVNEAGTDSTSESASFTFPVVDLGAPPPPPPPPGPPPLPNALVPGVTGWFTVPSQPTALEATSLVLKGVFPYDCGEIVDAHSDSGSVSFTMQPTAACPDTGRTWTQAFALGLLHAGPHVIHVTRRLITPDSNVVAEGDIGFYVWVDANTPPVGTPPNPEYPSMLIRCLTSWTTTTTPNSHTPTTLLLRGWFPYHCGQIIDAGVTAPNQVALTLRNNPNGCTDTTVTWFQSFDLGVLPGGPQQIGITLTVLGDPNTDVPATRQATITLDVDDTDVTASVPNPFVAQTSFIVTSGPNEHVDVGIYDLNGRRVKTVYRGALAGPQTFTWDGTRDGGARAAIGIYFSRVAFSNRVVTRKLVMLPK